MAKISVLIALLLQLGTMTKGFPCSDFYILMNKPGSIGEIMGQITIPSPSKNNSLYHLKVGFNTNPLLQRKEPVAQLDIAELEQEIIRAVQQNRTLLYHVYFPVGQPIPTLTKIIFNYKVLCNEETTDVQTTKEIERIVYSSGENSITQESSPNFPIFESNISLLNPVSFNDTDCGKPFPLNIVNPLTYHGFLTQPGEWPWLAAIFVTNTLEENFQFQCGGSVLTTKHVITAAHCLKRNNRGNETWPPYALLVALGRFNLTHWRERGSLNQEVANYVIHPDYTHSSSGDSDLAILIFRRPIKYGNSIRPICLWPNNLTDIQHVVNRLGYVVGWGDKTGKDKTGRRNTDDPRMVRVPIVKQETCLRSDTTFASLTSERTFCAGWLNETGPCNGDSGSGLVIYDYTNRRFLLRGIVSRSMFNEAYLCDPTRYIVYVDVAKYISWILVQISN
ncbi:serine protease gd [Solenopsis invicta]|uniref:serine protease gd n=1 Tax=Solenopsis invicta TaxID=13686 RepID=UPI00193E9C65|nr:serine protease gd [Solenopsis invicta]